MVLNASENIDTTDDLGYGPYRKFDPYWLTGSRLWQVERTCWPNTEAGGLKPSPKNSERLGSSGMVKHGLTPSHLDACHCLSQWQVVSSFWICILLIGIDHYIPTIFPITFLGTFGAPPCPAGAAAILFGAQAELDLMFSWASKQSPLAGWYALLFVVFDS